MAKTGIRAFKSRLTECPGCHSRDPKVRGETVEWDGRDPLDGETPSPGRCPDRYGFHGQMTVAEQLGGLIAASIVLPFGIRHVSHGAVIDPLHQKAKDLIVLLTDEDINDLADGTDPSLNRLEENFDYETQRQFWGTTYLECDEESKKVMLAWYAVIDAGYEKIEQLKGADL